MGNVLPVVTSTGIPNVYVRKQSQKQVLYLADNVVTLREPPIWPSAHYGHLRLLECMLSTFVPEER